MASALKNYIETKNRMRRIFNETEISYPGTRAEKAALFDMIDCDLSPENLHCDGEISRSAAAKKARHLNAAANELARLG